jgi:predicted regulator of Ras-like GTPase activity (Roadblock/LC7/MglB family)
MTKQEQITQLLEALKRSLPEVREAMVASPDGLPIATLGGQDTAARIAAMAATALGLGRRIAQTTQLGGMREVVVRGDQGYFVIYQAGEKGVLGITTPADANLGLLHLEAREVARALADIL